MWLLKARSKAESLKAKVRKLKLKSENGKKVISTEACGRRNL
jgi:hypothetical protein